MKKPRSDALLFNLPEEQQAQLAEWMLDGIPFHKCKELVQAEFGVTVKSLNPFSGFWSAVVSPALIARRARAVNSSNERAEEARKHPGQFDAATIDALKEKAYNLAIAPGVNPKDVKALFGLVLQHNQWEKSMKALALEVQKFQHELQVYRDSVAEQKSKIEASLKTARSGGLSAEALAQIEAAAKLL